MSSFVWMKVLESTPERYDRGIRMLSRGRIDDVYRRIAAAAAGPGRRVLDMGCGTGGVALACAARGAHVTAVDLDAGMLEVARTKPVPTAGRIDWLEIGIAEVPDRIARASMDAVVSCLVMSELGAEEQDYALDVAFDALVPGGVLVIGDETLPEDALARAWCRVRRSALTAATYALTQTTTRPVAHLGERVRAHGFCDVEETLMWSDTFTIVRARRGERAA